METQVQSPINLENWIEENREKFKPPVSNRYLYDGRDFFVMVIKGPNARNDFHQVDSEEYFYQLKGDIKVRMREGDEIVDHLVREGETFFIPPNVPHAPVRPPDTIGVVVERRRPAGEHEHVIFYRENCGAIVEDIDFDCGGHRRAFQPGDARLLERRRPPHLQEMRPQRTAAGAGEAVLGLARPSLCPKLAWHEPVNRQS